MSTFTQSLWAEVQSIYQSVLLHPFITGLIDGSLPKDCFRFYVVQDSLYLMTYARALSVAAAKAPDTESLVMFNQHAIGALAAERSLHESFFKDFNITEAEVLATPLAPTNLAYTNFLIAEAYRDAFATALAAVLPCYWVYAQVGDVLIKRGSKDPMYQRWIDTYGGDEFQEVVRQVLALTNRIEATLSQEDRDLMHRNFYQATMYEWQFWDMAWRKEAWPFSGLGQTCGVRAAVAVG